MTIGFEPDPGLPPLSWCARASASRVIVRHGPGVETRPDGFVEGAWDGDFEAFDFDRAPALAGSGGRVRDGAVVFGTPFHPLERLFALRRPGETLVSNSLVFLLTAAGDAIDPSYPGYFFDLVAETRRGIAVPGARLRTAAGAFVESFRCCNLTLRPDLSLGRSLKAPVPPPASYVEYFALLSGTLQRVAVNAAAAGRRTRYRLVAACSRGYDSTATASLAGLAGCREGVTFVRGSRRTGHPLVGTTETDIDDSGADSLRALGMRVTEFDRHDLVSVPGHPWCEFFVSPCASTDAATRLMEDVLRDGVLVSGRHGERYWGPTRRCRRRHLREVDDCHLSGQALGEFRMRVGFLQCPVAYVGALHGPAIYRITHSPEMRPWMLGTGYYDRPIARRIAEEAGVPRGNFGHTKFGSSPRFGVLGPESQTDFMAFVESAVPERIRRRLDPRPRHERRLQHRRLAYFRTNYAHLPLVHPLMNLARSDRLHALWDSIGLYQFHWGIERIRSRYRSP